MNADPFAIRVREARTALNLKQDELAEKLGVTVYTIRNYEQAKRRPELAAAYHLAQLLGLDLNELGKLAAENPLPPRIQ